MDAVIFLNYVVLVVVGLAGVAFMGFVLKYLDLQEQVAEQQEGKRVPQGVSRAESVAAKMPAFFGRPHASQVPIATQAFDDGLFALVQNHIQAEQAAVNEFVHLPSIDNLYRQVHPTLRVH